MGMLERESESPGILSSFSNLAGGGGKPVKPKNMHMHTLATK
jgi:hypothetical protein